MAQVRFTEQFADKSVEGKTVIYKAGATYRVTAKLAEDAVRAGAAVRLDTKPAKPKAESKADGE